MKYNLEYYNALAKLYGATSNPVVSADSWNIILQASTVGGNQTYDMTVLTGNPVALLGYNPKLAFVGNWSINIRTNVFGAVGACVLQFYKPYPGGAVQGVFSYSVASCNAAAVSAQVPFSEYYQYVDTAFFNIATMLPTGAGNTYNANIIFDGVRLTWGNPTV